MVDFHVVIPVRYASTRLPGKPLLEVNGKTIVEHVYNNACTSRAKSVIIATDDQRIRETAISFGAQVCMTSQTHQSGTDRIAEAVSTLPWPDGEIVVNLQGDEPQMPSANIDQVALLLADHPSASIATLCSRIRMAQQYKDENIVKVVKDMQGTALYFSRSCLPYISDVTDQALTKIAVYRHIGIYAYQVNYLQSFVTMSSSELEKTERLEQLRALQAGHKIIVAECEQMPGVGVDTLEDYQSLLTAH